MGPRPLMARAVRAALEDARVGGACVDTIAVVGFTIDAPGTAGLPIPRLTCAPAAVAQDIGAAPRSLMITHMGGNTPQWLVNRACEAIAAGESECTLITGAEFLGGLTSAMRSGHDFDDWGGGPDGKAELVGDPRPGSTPHEADHGLDLPVNVYPLFEAALRARRGTDWPTHMARIGRVFAGFTRTASQNPHAWFGTIRTPEELVTEGPDNRMIGFPYTKYLNSIIAVDQAAALVVMSTRAADAAGVPQDRRVYLHGCADAHDNWNPLDRVDYWSSPAIAAVGRHTLEPAGHAISDIDLFDIYSCFPCAVEIACDALGLDFEDPRGLTVTGGLPYAGGPGNNYVTHSIARMVTRLRARPGSLGLVTANGWFLTKHSAGLYSTTPREGAWARVPASATQALVDARPGPPTTEDPEGAATIETATVIHGRKGPVRGIVIGRDADGRRFVANTDLDAATLARLTAEDAVGAAGSVARDEASGLNRFVFAP